MIENNLQTGQPVPLIDTGRCDGCGLCIRACANNVLAVQDSKAVVARPESCEYTGLCALICPKEAIQLPFVIVEGVVQKDHGAINVLAAKVSEV